MEAEFGRRRTFETASGIAGLILMLALTVATITLAIGSASAGRWPSYLALVLSVGAWLVTTSRWFALASGAREREARRRLAAGVATSAWHATLVSRGIASRPPDGLPW